MSPRSREEFEIAIICALPVEADAVEALFDEYDDIRTYGKQEGDDNTYTTGRINSHHVVLAVMPGMGNRSSASVARSLRMSFTRIKLALVVGICGGAPYSTDKREIILGDVIISDSVIEYDFGRQYPDGFVRKSGVKETLGQPNQEIRSFLNGLRTSRRQAHVQQQIARYLEDIQGRDERHWSYPGAPQDILFPATYRHRHYEPGPGMECACFDCHSSQDSVCELALKSDCQRLGCAGQSIQRRRLDTDIPETFIHIGTIASANTVMRSGEHRERLANDEGIIGFEMEGARVWDSLPCIIIKGVCDYADSHKNKAWQQYATATAACCAKAFLTYWVAGLPQQRQASSHPKPSSTVPFERDEVFVGREDTIMSINKAVEERIGRTSRRAALVGLGGVGKSQIAIEFTYRVRESAPSTWVFWVHASNRTRFEQGYRDVAAIAKIPGRDDPKCNVLELVKKWLCDDMNGNWLMILDNADDMDTIFNTGDKNMPLVDYLPHVSHGSILVTSRNQKLVRNIVGPGGQVIPVEPMSTNEGITLLKTRVTVDQSNETEAELLVKALKCIPLAITQAGAYMSHGSHPMSVSTYLELFRQNTLRHPTATDSGYASMSNQSRKNVSQAAVERLTSASFDKSTEVNASGQIRSNEPDDNDGYLLLHANETTSDTDSIYTAGPNIQPLRREAYISLLADELLDQVSTVELDEASIERVYRALPELLKAFAVKVGSSNSLQIHRDVMVFVRKHRREIARSMRIKCIEENSVRYDVLGNDRARIDPIRNWNLDLDDLEDPDTAPEAPDDVLGGDDEEELAEIDRSSDFLPELQTYKNFILGLPAYDWLLGSIQRVLNFSVPTNSENNIRDLLLTFLPKARRVSRKEKPPRLNLTFTIEWDPCLFLQEQGYLESPERAIERTITITGSENDAEAATTAQYLSQTWPSSGIYLLRLLKSVVQDVSKIPYLHNLPDGTQLIAWSEGPDFKLKAIGIAESIAEVGEQLAWLTSALRSSPYETGVAVINPFIGGMWTNSSRETSGELPSDFFCKINFNIDVIKETGETSNGQCWLRLFRNPVMVKGYPIPRKPAPGMGLEISLDTMAGLLETCRINIFDNKIFIKGFSTMLVPTLYSGNIIFWHLLYRKNGDRISYLDSMGIHDAHINLTDLETSRHILGWCSKVKYLTGSADANYAIDRSWLRRFSNNSKLKDISVSQSRLIKSDHMVAYGNKDKSLQVSRGTYRTALYALSKKYFLLWDVGYKRGWLMNGTNALLHLLRASLEFNKIDDMSFAFLFKPEHFKEAKDPYTVSAAMEVLMNPENLNIELYEESEPCEQDEVAYFRVRDRVNNLYETLEKMLDYQSMITIERGEGLNITPRKYLERWDFKDIATNEDPIYPRLAKLKTIGKGWVDFTRDIQAIPLFGRGFGELIEPVDKWDVCGYWQTLPSYKFLLAISMEDLSRIMDRLGHPNLDPPRLTDTIVWHPYKIVSTTTCTCSQDTVNHCQLAQCLWPLHMGQEFKKGTSLPLKDIGAVAFGHNTGIGWMWNDFGDPERGDPPSSVEESDDDDLVDSGIGSSILLSIGPQPQEHLGFESSTHAFKHEDYKIAIICALPKELRAIRAIFDSPHQDLPRRENDTNTYVLGRVGSHNVIAACLPYEESGTNAASKVASDMEKSFPSVKWYFVVGIGGGVPSKKHDIRLGDVVVSTAIIQHDKGKRIQDNSKFQSTGIIHRPARSLMTAISRLQSDLDIRPHFLEPHIERILNLRPEYRSPEREDKLFEPHSQHEDGQETCKNCMGPEVHRKSRSAGPHVHYGLIASGNQVIKDATVRDRMGTEMEVLCFEMEGAGVMTTGQCLIIRGISDYADSHKNDEWHNYAAATAAAYTKFFLLRFPNLDVLNREVIHIQKRPALLEKNDSCRLDYRINRSERSATALASAGAFDEIAALDVYTVSLFLFLLLFFVLFVFYF